MVVVLVFGVSCNRNQIAQKQVAYRIVVTGGDKPEVFERVFQEPDGAYRDYFAQKAQNFLTKVERDYLSFIGCKPFGRLVVFELYLLVNGEEVWMQTERQWVSPCSDCGQNQAEVKPTPKPNRPVQVKPNPGNQHPVETYPCPPQQERTIPLPDNKYY